ncbi:MAG TPA: hypothetical protein PLM33_06600 [Acidobacteriota bacterium]|jgi:hypothetical protein|nr:hypothetical protein [Acidobacteriota bacterium]HRR26520.1 hypothetical protein [Acidobacteriota bacterium]HRR56011.1 hypothetical protein [Acidobacteriota bacterium]HRV06871.1 hypothetical protein [Acidobacteriota bacterium]
MKPDPCVCELLKCGLDDWVDAAEVVWVAVSVGKAKDEKGIRELFLRMIREVLERGWMKIGDVDVVGPGGFAEWGLSVDEALEKLEREWDALGRLPVLWELCWLDITEEGADIAERLMESERLPE